MKKNLIAVLVALLVVFGLCQCGKPATETMPDVVGQSVAQAIETLNQAGYKDQTLKNPNGGKADTGVVVGQSPKAHTEQATDTKVTLTVRDFRQEKRERIAKAKKMEEARKAREAEEARKAREARLTQVANEINGKNAVQSVDRLKAENMFGRISPARPGILGDDPEQDLRGFNDSGIEWLVVDATVRMDDGVIDISVDTKTHVDAVNAEKALEGKLSMGAAITACEEYGRQQYPAGFKAHWLGKDAAPADADTWSVRMSVDVTNMFGAKMKDRTCFCKVTGTTDSPQVVDFVLQ